jgi:hypothetical protein
LGLGLTYALFKAGEKVRKFDRAIGRARSQREGAAEA